jgi:hypothetical protein
MRARSSNCIFLPQKRGGMENLAADKVIPKVSRSRRFFVRRAHQAAGHSDFSSFLPAGRPSHSLRTAARSFATCTSPGSLTFVTHFSCPLYVSRGVIPPTLSTVTSSLSLPSQYYLCHSRPDCGRNGPVLDALGV